MTLDHEITPEGESTLNWAIREPDFLGTSRQLVCCGRCGGLVTGGQNHTRHVRDALKPTMHWLCDGCYEALPE